MRYKWNATASMFTNSDSSSKAMIVRPYCLQMYGHGEFTDTLILVGDECRNVNKNLPLFGALLIRNWFSMN
jgi:hypothetical protein